MKLFKHMTVVIAAAMAMSVASAANKDDTKPDVVLLATGGTIAAASASNTDTVNYVVGKLGVDTLLKAVPEIYNFANVTGVQVANVPSPDITNEVMLKLSKEVNQKLNSGSDGVVVTHGTDTLEETAFFLDVTTKSDKPVVLVGAMRPASALSADGPMNLLQAVSLASNPNSKGRGAMVVMSDRIQPAFYMTKTHSSATDTFKAVEQGSLGQFVGTKPYFFYESSKPNNKPYFDVSNLKDLPLVSIVYLHTNADLPMFEAAVKGGAKGIVVAGTGNGSLPEPLKARVKELMDNGIPVVRATRTGSGFVGKSEKMGGIGAGWMTPQKARILLSLALTKTNSPVEIEKVFGTN